MTLQGTLKGGVIVVDQPAPWPEGTRVEVVFVSAADKPATLQQALLKLAGTLTDLPSDMAEQHDHYIHGTPKR